MPPAIAVALPRPEFDALHVALSEAGYEAIPVRTTADLEKILITRRDLVAAVLDLEKDFDAAVEMYAQLHDGGRNLPALMLIPQGTFGRLELGSGVARDEYFVRPYTTESIRWRLEAMLIRLKRGAAERELPAEEPSEAGLVGFESGEEPATTGTTVIPASVEARAREVSAPVAAVRAVAVQAEPPVQRGRILIVFNPKGGVGKTTISINVGTSLRLRKQQRVLLVDCDTITGHIAPSLGLERPRTLATAWQENDREGCTESLADIATTHSSGVGVLVLASSPLHTEILQPERVAEAVAEARESFDWIILDMHPDYGPLNQALFALADRILLPVTPDVPCIRAAVQFREVAVALGIRDRVSLVINRAKSGVKSSDVERVVAVPTIARIRSAGMVFVRAADEGHAAVERFPNAKVVGDIDGLTDRLMAGEIGDKVATAHRRRLRGSVRKLVGRFAQSS